MKIDTYTKAVLTVIAICLSILTFKDINLFPKAHAHNSPPKTENLNYGLVPINADGSINVRLSTDQVVDVRLRGIDEAPTLRWEAINVRIKNY